MDFTNNASFKSYGEKTYFFVALALSALRRLRVQSDLLDGTALKVLPLVVCTKDLIYTQSVDTSLHSRFRDGKRTETRIGMEGICITHSCIPPL